MSLNSSSLRFFEKWELAPDAGFGWAAIARLKPRRKPGAATMELNVILSRELGSQSFSPTQER